MALGIDVGMVDTALFRGVALEADDFLDHFDGHNDGVGVVFKTGQGQGVMQHDIWCSKTLVSRTKVLRMPVALPVPWCGT